MFDLTLYEKAKKFTPQQCDHILKFFLGYCSNHLLTCEEEYCKLCDGLKASIEDMQEKQNEV